MNVGDQFSKDEVRLLRSLDISDRLAKSLRHSHAELVDISGGYTHKEVGGGHWGAI